MAFWQEWWIWMVAGIGLAILEVMISGFILLGFAIGAFLTGALMWIGILGSSLPTSLLVCALVALVAWIVLRRVLGIRKGQKKVWNKDINEG